MLALMHNMREKTLLSHCLAPTVVWLAVAEELTKCIPDQQEALDAETLGRCQQQEC